MLNWWRDIRFGLRMLARNKGFTAAAVLALALGIGPNIAIFSIVWATLLAPLPYPHGNRIVEIRILHTGQPMGIFAGDFAQIEVRAKLFQALYFQSWSPVHMTNPGGAISQYSGEVVSTGNVFHLPMALGRYFKAGDGAPGKNQVVVIKHDFWVNRFHSDPHMIGKSILIQNKPYTIIGVLAAGPEDRVCCNKFYVPMQFLPGGRYPYIGGVTGLLKPGISMAQAQAEIASIGEHIAATMPGHNSDHAWSWKVQPLKDATVAPALRRNLWLLLAAVGLVLLIACSNIANLLLARGARRRQELAVRSALGASRWQVFSQMLAESLVLALLGGAVGVALGWAIMRGAVAIVPQLPAQSVVRMNLPVFAFAFAATVLSGIVFGCVPAWHAARVNLSEALKQGARAVTGHGRSRLQSILVAAEFSLALTLLAGAGVTMHSFWNLTNVNLGFRTDHVLTGFLSPGNPAQFAGPGKMPPPAQLEERARRIVDHLRSLPGVENAALAGMRPLGGHNSFPFTIEGRPAPADNKPVAELNEVTPGYFKTFGVRLLRGRAFNDEDTLSSEPVVMVSESFVRQYFPHVNPLDQEISFLRMIPGLPPGKPVAHRVIGVFANVANGAHIGEKNTPAMYVSFFQNPAPVAAFAVRSEVAPGSLIAEVRHALQRAAPTLAMGQIKTMTQVVNTQLRGSRFSMILLAGFALVALLLAALGIYGVMAFAVAQRTHEIGLRMALGAQRVDVVALIVRGGMKPAVLGAALGLAGAYGLGRLLRSSLYGVGSIDFVSLAAVAVLLLLVGWLASWLPARRSARVDPMIALREE